MPLEVPVPLRSLAFRQEDLISSPQCDDAGVTMGMRRRLVRDGRWARMTRGVYDIDPLRDRRHEADHRRRQSAWLGMLAYGPDAVAVGACALALHGVGGLPLQLRPEVMLPEGAFGKNRDGMRVRQLSSVHVTRFGERRIATLKDALVTALPDLPRQHAVAVLDDLVHHGRLSPDQVAQLSAQLRGRRGAARAIVWLALVDGRAESPLETFGRLECIDAGVPPDELQVVITARDGRFLGRGDLGWRLGDGRWLIVELDGREFHDRPEALHRDRARQNALLLHGGVDLLRFTNRDLSTPGVVGGTVHAALTLARQQR